MEPIAHAASQALGHFTKNERGQHVLTKQGFYGHCACCAGRVWVDTTHGVRPGPDLCGQGCYDEYGSRPYMPAWAVED